MPCSSLPARFLLVALLVLLVACNGRRRTTTGGDAGGPVDAGTDSSLIPDAGDSGTDLGGDLGPIDLGHPDLGHPDLGGGGGLYHGWICPIAGCSTSSYSTTAPTALGGSYPYNVGDSNACKAWKLAATVCTDQPVMYTDETNWMCESSGGFTDPTFGTYCMAPSTQYACSTCPGACNASCSYIPLSLRDCSGTEVTQL